MATSVEDSLWAITAYFNPMGYRRRRANYRTFRERLNVPLLAVELAYGEQFELGEEDADLLIQLRARDVMWQKERLLNVALDALPPSCRNVVWTDCDVVFQADAWAEGISNMLERFVLVQVFSRVAHLSPQATPADTRPAIVATQPSAAHAIATGARGPHRFGRPTLRGPGSTNNGLGWAMRRELLGEHGFYDACVVGGGDLAMVCAAQGCFQVATRNMTDQQEEHYAAWARPFHEVVGAEIGFLDGLALHLWHGAVGDRHYRRRHDGLRCWEFDPFEDIEHAENGVWRWSTAKPHLHAYVSDYFAARNEDG